MFHLFDYFFRKKNNKTIDPIHEYKDKSKIAFLKLYNFAPESLHLPQNFSASFNIDPSIYDKKMLSEILSDGDNSLEKTWKSRVLIEYTPIGNIMMFYDIFKHGFSYYCDQPIVQYDILNSVAMKYVMKFKCLDFFMDEYILTKSSPLKAVFFEDDKKPDSDPKTGDKNPGSKLAVDLKTAPFAKLKNYAISNKNNTSKNTPIYFRTNYAWFWSIWFRIQYFMLLPVYKVGIFIRNYLIGNSNNVIKDLDSDTEPVLPEKEKIRNKFIYLGRFRNIQILQKTKKTNTIASGGPSKYDALFSSSGKKFSYKDYKSGLFVD